MRPLRYVSTPAADRDSDELAEFYAEEIGEDLVVRFLLALDQAIHFIRQNPAAGSPRAANHSRLNGLRSWPIPGFEDIRIYYVQPDEYTLRIVRVLHGKRDVESILRKESG